MKEAEKVKKSNQLNQSNQKGWGRGKITLFLIAGKIDAGKTFFGKRLEEALIEKQPNTIVRTMGFANPVKSTARTAFGWDGRKDEKGRRLLQVVGTDAGREYNKNIWVEKTYNNIVGHFPPNFVILDDWRFENEYDYFVGKDFIGDIVKIRVFRDGEVDSDHASEHGLPIEKDYYDYYIDNNGTKEEMYEIALNIVEETCG